jgi:hypothetical protein
LAASPSRTSNSQDFDDAGIDDDLDPAKMEELDRLIIMLDYLIQSMSSICILLLAAFHVEF